MALDIPPSELFESLSSGKKGTSVILSKIKSELSEEKWDFFDTWSQKYKSEVDVIVALWRWEEESISILGDLSANVQKLIQDFTQKRINHIIQMKEKKNSNLNNRETL